MYPMLGSSLLNGVEFAACTVYSVTLQYGRQLSDKGWLALDRRVDQWLSNSINPLCYLLVLFAMTNQSESYFWFALMWCCNDVLKPVEEILHLFCEKVPWSDCIFYVCRFVCLNQGAVLHSGSSL